MCHRSAAAKQQVRHTALFYGPVDGYLTEVLGFVETGLGNDEAVFVAVPRPKLELLRDHLDGRQGRVSFADMAHMGANPAWIIPEMRAFVAASAGRPVRYVGEPAWRGRSAEELRETTRHEALINLAFADARVRILCPYDASSLDPEVITGAEQTHPVLIRGGRPGPSSRYDSSAPMPEACDEPLPAPPGNAAAITYRTALGPVRDFVAEHGRMAGLGNDRTGDLVIAASELAANTLCHADGSGTLSVWATPDEVICEVHDAGRISDPLIGRRRPAPDAAAGHGLWVVHQVCDLVELRTGSGGTTIRLHMRLAGDGGRWLAALGRHESTSGSASVESSI
jgi:anti-sigma regulatory factor (Ser/Thr protein kinase)